MIPGISAAKPILYLKLERDQIKYVCAQLLDIQRGALPDSQELSTTRRISPSLF
jgi:hypothetical protein